MNDTFRRVAAFCGLRLSYYTTAVLLIITFLALAPTAYLTASPLYILLALALLPSVIKAMFFSSEQKKREPAMAYPLFCKKYRYNLVLYRSMNISYLLLFILLAAWHISYVSHTDIPAVIRTLPSLISSLSLLTRVLGGVAYRIYFRFFTFRAMR